MLNKKKLCMLYFISSKQINNYTNNYKILYRNKNIEEGFSNISSETSFKKIKPNNLYYGLKCKYIKNDSFYDALKEYGFQMTDGVNTTIVDASLIVPCSYETTEKEINDLTKGEIILQGKGTLWGVFYNKDLKITQKIISKLPISFKNDKSFAKKIYLSAAINWLFERSTEK